MNDTPTPPAGSASLPPERAYASPRLLRAALAVSVAVNLLILGIAAGALYHQNGPGARAAMTRDLGFGPFSEALAPPERRALRDWLRQRAPELRRANAQRRADVVALQAALRADPFVPQDLTAALENMRSRLSSQLDLGHQALGAVILAMPDSERRALADRLDRGLQRDDDREMGGHRDDRTPRQDRPRQDD